MRRVSPALITAALLAGVPSLAVVGKRPTPPLEVEIKNVHLAVTGHVTVKIHYLRGRFLPVREGEIPFFDDPESYVVDVEAGEVAMGMASLNALVNEHAFGHGKRPIKNLELGVEDGLLKQKGVLDKKIDIPFMTKGTVEPTPDGKIRVHAKSIKSLGLSMKPLMKLFGIEMDDLLKVEPGHGVWVDDNDLVLDPQLMLPPPQLRGKVTEVHVEGDTLVQTFGRGVPRGLSPPAISRNHIYWHGGDLKFGKLIMVKTDLELVDMDPKDPFDFSARRWNDQLVAGYSKNTVKRGLKAYMPDFNDLHRRAPRTP